MNESLEKRRREWIEKILKEIAEWRKQRPSATVQEISEAVTLQKILEALRERIAKQSDGNQLPSVGLFVRVSETPRIPRISSTCPKKTDGFPFRNDFSHPLWERIQAWCEYANWYGPECHVHDSPFDQRSGFAYPPATEEQLREVERKMGYPHPPLLRDLYLHVANGGFGLWEGLIGIPGSYDMLHARDPRYDDARKEEALKKYGEAFCRISYPDLFDPLSFDLEEREKWSDDPRLICMAEREWPMDFLNLCRGQEEEGFYIHARSGHVYLAGNAWNREKTPAGEEATTLLHLQADSLEEWFERWLAGELESRYYSDEPEPGERKNGPLIVDTTDLDPFLDY